MRALTQRPTRTYRSKAEEEEWAGRDPIKRMGEHLLAQGLATQSILDQVEKDVTAAVDDAVAFADASPTPGAGRGFAACVLG